MKLKTIYLRTGSALNPIISEWAVNNGLEVEEVSLTENYADEINGLIIFNQNGDIEKDAAEVRNAFDGKSKPVHRIDINGTLMVGVSNFDLWLERNGCVKVLMLGSDTLVENGNLNRFFEAIKYEK